MRRKKPKKPHSGRFEKVEIFLFYALPVIIVAAIVVLAGFAYSAGHEAFDPGPVDAAGEGHTAEITITNGMTSEDSSQLFREIGMILQSDGLVKDADDFAVLAQYAEYADAIEPGTYELSSEMTVTEMAKVLSNRENSMEAQTSEDSEETE